LRRISATDMRSTGRIPTVSPMGCARTYKYPASHLTQKYSILVRPRLVSQCFPLSWCRTPPAAPGSAGGRGGGPTWG